MRKVLVIVLVAVMALAALPTFAQDDAGTIIDVAVADGRFTTLVAAVEAAGLTETLSGEGPFTVFAPTDDAFAALPEGTVEALLADPAALTDILLYHVVEGEVLAETVVTLEAATTLQGSDVTITVDEEGNVLLNDTVQVIITDVVASNGVIHVIDTVLLPPADDMMTEDYAHVRVAHFSPDTPAVDIYVDGEVAIEGLEFPTITDWLEVPAGDYSIAVAPAGTSLEDAAIGPADLTFEAGAWVTVAATGSLTAGTLAPVVLAEDYSDLDMADARVTIVHAIEDAPAVDVLLADGTELVDSLAFGEYATLDVPAGTYDLQVTPAEDNSTVLFDLAGTELAPYSVYMVAAVGTLSADDEVDPQLALAVTDLAAMMEDMDDMDDMDMGSIIDIAAADGRFTTLLAAVDLAGLTETLSGEGSFTVFAPVDDAFTSLPEGTLEAVLADSELLTSILLFHVVNGAVYAEDVLAAGTLVTLQGGELTITVDEEGNVFINDTVQIIITDIEASNGVIHVIDGVLVP